MWEFQVNDFTSCSLELKAPNDLTALRGMPLTGIFSSSQFDFGIQVRQQYNIFIYLKERNGDCITEALKIGNQNGIRLYELLSFQVIWREIKCFTRAVISRAWLR